MQTRYITYRKNKIDLNTIPDMFLSQLMSEASNHKTSIYTRMIILEDNHASGKQMATEVSRYKRINRIYYAIAAEVKRRTNK